MTKKLWMGVLMASMVAFGAEAETTAARGTPVTNAVTTNQVSVQTTQKDFPIKGDGTLQLTVPSTWHSSTRDIRQAGNPVTVIELKPGSQQDFAVMLEVASVGEENTKKLDIKEILRTTGEIELPNSVEKSLAIQDLNGPELVGAYFTVTDKRYKVGMPQPGQYKYLTQGYGKLGGLVITFRVVSNRATGTGQTAALEIIKNAHLEKSKPAEQK
jgi:hypothetical protein